MDHRWRLGVVAALAVSSLALGACDEDEPDAVSTEAYHDEMAALCQQHRSVVLDADPDPNAPDAEMVSFLLAEYIPRWRAIVQSLGAFGYPADNAAEYRDAEARALHAMNEIEDDTPELVDRLRARLLDEDEDPFLDLTNALEDMDIPCV